MWWRSVRAAVAYLAIQDGVAKDVGGQIVPICSGVHAAAYVGPVESVQGAEFHASDPPIIVLPAHMDDAIAFYQGGTFGVRIGVYILQ